MKVLDLCCANGHAFEGWFASEQDFVDQCAKALVQCPVCADAAITKKLSAPRLNLSGQGTAPKDDLPTTTPATLEALAQALIALSQKMLQNTEDVGSQFADEARRIHYGESRMRAIRGETTMDDAHALLDEGIDVIPLILPAPHKKSLH